jgi:hypothetical protein
VNAIDAGKQVDIIYTNLSKAFDRVPHHILVKKLSSYGMTGSFLNWLKSYLSDRTFYVVMNGFDSVGRTISSGVP